MQGIVATRLQVWRAMNNQFVETLNMNARVKYVLSVF